MTPSSQFNVSTLSILENQQLQLEKAVQEKKDHIETLKEASNLLILESGRICETTKDQLNIINRAPFQSPLKTKVKQRRPTYSPKLAEEFITLANKVKKGEATEEFNNYITQINNTVGEINAQTQDLKEEMKNIDKTIEKLKKNIAQRKETIQLTDRQTKELKDK